MISPSDCENSDGEKWSSASSIYDFRVKDLDGNTVTLDKFRDKVCLIVNVASYCGFGPLNYNQLGQLYEQFSERGFEILAFPCNQWAQEPSCETDLKEFVRKKKINYQFFGKVLVNGSSAHPLYKYLKTRQNGTFGNAIKWNFTKFICDRNGQPVRRYGPMARVQEIARNIEELLG